MKDILCTIPLKQLCLLLCSISLAACATLPPPVVAAAAPAPEPETKPVVIAPVCRIESALAQLNNTISGNCPSDKLLILAQQMMSNHTDLNRLQAQLEALQNTLNDPASQGMAKLLSNQLAERKRLTSLLDKQTIAAKEQQKRANDLAAKLDALKEMEKDMLERSKKP
ncbi:hypothetical protein ACFQNF_15250 [Iodobacter arcticus]|uniref:Secreted protein n=1 Tax=Iodobacter arcticus TaxID=590593 RepID=A0ABW2QZX7_9NEIS